MKLPNNASLCHEKTPPPLLIMVMFMFTYAYKCLLYRLGRQPDMNYSFVQSCFKHTQTNTHTRSHYTLARLLLLSITK